MGFESRNGKDSRTIGYCKMTRHSGKFAHIKKGVLAEHRHVHGIGALDELAERSSQTLLAKK